MATSGGISLLMGLALATFLVGNDAAHGKIGIERVDKGMSPAGPEHELSSLFACDLMDQSQASAQLSRSRRGISEVSQAAQWASEFSPGRGDKIRIKTVDKGVSPVGEYKLSNLFTCDRVDQSQASAPPLARHRRGLSEKVSDAAQYRPYKFFTGLDKGAECSSRAVSDFANSDNAEHSRVADVNPSGFTHGRASAANEGTARLARRGVRVSSDTAEDQTARADSTMCSRTAEPGWSAAKFELSSFFVGPVEPPLVRVRRGVIPIFGNRPEAAKPSESPPSPG